MLKLENILVAHGSREVLKIDHLEIPSNSFIAILGHNGSGKSTLMNIMARHLEPQLGVVLLRGYNLISYCQRDFAKVVAYLPQFLPSAPGLTVRELVKLGRYPYRGLIGRWRKEDYAAIEVSMINMDVNHYADRLVDTLSGGERQRAWIAMLLAQEAPLILLDEPIAALDLTHQYQLMTKLKELNKYSGRSIVAIVHDLNLAARFADRIIILKGGRVHFDGAPEGLFSERFLTDLYGMGIQLLDQPGSQIKIMAVSP